MFFKNNLFEYLLLNKEIYFYLEEVKENNWFKNFLPVSFPPAPKIP
jgi:hypothetical protein